MDLKAAEVLLAGAPAVFLSADVFQTAQQNQYRCDLLQP